MAAVFEDAADQKGGGGGAPHLGSVAIGRELLLDRIEQGLGRYCPATRQAMGTAAISLAYPEGPAFSAVLTAWPACSLRVVAAASPLPTSRIPCCAGARPSG